MHILLVDSLGIPWEIAPDYCHDFVCKMANISVRNLRCPFEEGYLWEDKGSKQPSLGSQ